MSPMWVNSHPLLSPLYTYMFYYLERHQNKYAYLKEDSHRLCYKTKIVFYQFAYCHISYQLMKKTLIYSDSPERYHSLGINEDHLQACILLAVL